MIAQFTIIAEILEKGNNKETTKHEIHMEDRKLEYANPNITLGC